MTKPLIIKIDTLTPLWTGGADGKSNRLHATGIIGSLRWWYEAVVRGLGGSACDPAVQGCIYDQDKPNRGLCLGCQTFGATGWARRFRLIVEDNTNPEGKEGKQQTTDSRHNRNGNQPSTWYFNNGKGRGGEFILKIIPTDPNFNPMLIYGLLKLIEEYAGLAAKTQLGYGRIQVEKNDSFYSDQFVQTLFEATRKQSTQSTTTALPSLTDMFFATVSAQDQGLTATVNLKYDIRAVFRDSFGNNKKLRHWICGTVQGERQASKIRTGQSIDNEMPVWGWIPQVLPVQNVEREQVIHEVQKSMSNYGTILSWREFSSERDTQMKCRDIAVFLNSLLDRKGAS